VIGRIRDLFRQRYDYHAEWLRFTRTMGQGGSASEALPERAIRAIAEMTESAGGLLFMPEQDGTLVLAARWRWPAIEVPGIAFPVEFAAGVERTGDIVDIGKVGGGLDPERDGALPEWLAAAADAWALVPLLHLDRLHGVIVLAHPAVPRRLDREDIDLLGIVGRQLASYLAERAGQEALMEARQFDEFSRRIAFVMHDVKNLASQLSLLARNAERHADNPAFRADMLVTLRNSADKLNALLARLGRYGANGGTRRERVELRELAARVKDRLADGASLSIIDSGNVAVLADADALEQALTHLVQNAVEAGAGHGPVYLDVASDGVRGRIDVIDSGGGMSADFIRDGLFRPFVSSKPSGFGIGAFEARELVRAMDGRLDVDSREGIGTRFSISLPLFAAAELLRNVEAA
jgi:putative PEP-CTERM system histidine kinase